MYRQTGLYTNVQVQIDSFAYKHKCTVRQLYIRTHQAYMYRCSCTDRRVCVQTYMYRQTALRTNVNVQIDSFVHIRIKHTCADVHVQTDRFVYKRTCAKRQVCKHMHQAYMYETLQGKQAILHTYLSSVHVRGVHAHTNRFVHIYIRYTGTKRACAIKSVRTHICQAYVHEIYVYRQAILLESIFCAWDRVTLGVCLEGPI